MVCKGSYEDLIPPGFGDFAIAEFSAQFLLECDRTELHGIARFGAKNHGKANFSCHWENFLISERGISIS